MCPSAELAQLLGWGRSFVIEGVGECSLARSSGSAGLLQEHTETFLCSQEGSTVWEPLALCPLEQQPWWAEV